MLLRFAMTEWAQLSSVPTIWELVRLSNAGYERTVCLTVFRKITKEILVIQELRWISDRLFRKRVPETRPLIVELNSGYSRLRTL